MTNRILAEQYTRGEVPRPRLLTTAGAARLLGLSVQGVLWLVAQGLLRCEPAESGVDAAHLRIFHRAEVQRVLVQRREAATTNRAARLRAVRIRMLKADYQPRQMDLLSRLRLVPRGERALQTSPVKGARAFEESTRSDRRSYVDRKVAHR
jgi:hypothetical protein